jgi:signal transduction histidine kinase
VGNSLKFTSAGFIEIGMKAMESEIEFFVIDTGIGIHPSKHEYVFKRFYQLEDSQTRKYGGNGLGLTISKSIVELLGGRIGLESEPGKGSKFFFTIPRD